MTTPAQPRPVPDRLRDVDSETLALADALRSHSHGPVGLRQAIRDFVRARKAQGSKPEQVVIAVKAAVRAASPARGAAGSPEELAAEQLMNRSVEWCITEYFRIE